METLSAFYCAESTVLAAPSVYRDLIAVSVSARVASTAFLFHWYMTTNINCAKRSKECSSGAEAINLAADKLFIGFENYTIRIVSFGHEYHVPHVQS